MYGTAADPLTELLELDVRVDGEVGVPPLPPSRRRWERMGAAGGAAALVLSAAALWAALSRPGAVEGADAEPSIPEAVPAFAEMYVSDYLTAAGEDRRDVLRTYYPAVPEIGGGDGADRFVTQVVTTEVSPQRLGGGWRVETAATVLVGGDAGYVPDGTHHYVVGVVSTGSGLAATSLPGRLPAPPSGAVPATVDGTDVEDESLRSAVEAFLAAYLLGAGDLDPLVTPGSGIVPVAPPPYRAISIDQVTAVGPVEGLRYVRITGTATPHLGSPLPIEHHLAMLTDDGAWKVASLPPGPPLRG